ncbi:hypothetical protein Dtox_0624 [Desulfofarcimen acetoxidans DSM 771]|jgi:hypothetical protein|uniref:Uncharacterized protein n=1 Tax=Desulfofarcimen acetoxidans (strain ATCC 49208 / DSM 771 / KCTC 5769 / VKM B-1644 / 5575) TaxID=485916 RepID=C8W199_DESAS|nr:hypothetical protein [Desulfofarcimen acetoxidans]ACV61544.1 hypothetical protein Dtox_0624 [Desulfofarcimen acetoxidans DSM 771]
MKKPYESPEIEITEFEISENITTITASSDEQLGAPMGWYE